MYIYINHIHLYNWTALPCYLTTAVLNDCYRKETAYTALVYSYWASFHDVYGDLCHAHYRYRLQLPYKSHKIYLTNHMGSISRHITPLVIQSLGGRQTHTHINMQTFVDVPACSQRTPGLTIHKNYALWIYYALNNHYLLCIMTMLNAYIPKTNLVHNTRKVTVETISKQLEYIAKGQSKQYYFKTGLFLNYLNITL